MAIRITQAGVALTVGIIIVTALIIGGFFYVRNAGEQARREEAIKIAEQNLEDQSDEGVALNDDSKNNSENSSDKPTDSNSGDTTNNQDTSNQDTSSSSSTNNSSADQPAGELPQTGPADSLTSVVVLSLLSFSAASYVNSRRRMYNEL